MPPLGLPFSPSACRRRPRAARIRGLPRAARGALSSNCWRQNSAAVFGGAVARAALPSRVRRERAVGEVGNPLYLLPLRHTGQYDEPPRGQEHSTMMIAKREQQKMELGARRPGGPGPRCRLTSCALLGD